MRTPVKLAISGMGLLLLALLVLWWIEHKERVRLTSLTTRALTAAGEALDEARETMAMTSDLIASGQLRQIEGSLPPVGFKYAQSQGA